MCGHSFIIIMQKKTIDLLTFASCQDVKLRTHIQFVTLDYLSLIYQVD
jgi:hypothetical protein